MFRLSSGDKFLWIIVLLGSLASILTVILASLRSNTIEFLYVVLFSAFITLILVSEFERYLVSKKTHLSIIIFINIYIIFIIWLGAVKIIPEYKSIIDFEEKKSLLTLNIMIADDKKNEYFKLKAELELAKLYSNAPDPIFRRDKSIRNSGILMLSKTLKKMIEENKNYINVTNEKDGRINISDDMYILAEAAFMHKSKAFAKEWYKRAYDFGRADALQRYNQLMKTWYLGEKLDESISPFKY